MESVAIREYTHDVERVFEVVLSIVNKHYNIKNIDKATRCIEVDSGMSLFFLWWGIRSYCGCTKQRFCCQSKGKIKSLLEHYKWYEKKSKKTS